MPEFNPMRVLRNRVLEQELPDAAERPTIGRTTLGDQEVDIPRFSNLVPTRATAGDLDEMPLLAGQGVGLVDAVKSAASVIADITAQTSEMLSRYQP